MRLWQLVILMEMIIELVMGVVDMEVEEVVAEIVIKVGEYGGWQSDQHGGNG